MLPISTEALFFSENEARDSMSKNDLTILFVTRTLSNRIEKSSDYLLKELRKKANVITSDLDGHIHDILKTINIQPDFILLNDMKPDYCPHIGGFTDLAIPVGAIVHELKYRPYQRRRFYHRENIQYLFTHYRDPFLSLFPEFHDRMIWFPHHVPIDIFKDYQFPRDIDVLMMGAIYPHLYPMRAKFYEILKNERNFVYHPHPGYQEICDWKHVYAGEKYAREINRAKIFVTCDSIEHYPVMKYFEVLACNTLLLATPSQELSDLGFIDGETFVAVNEHNLKDKITYYLQNEDERRKIARQGFEMVRRDHSTEKRTNELLSHINKIICKKV